jgi:two-component system CheB/CheR fusion protein
MDKWSEEAFRKLLDDVLESSEFAWWDWDIVNNKVSFNEHKVTMLGYSMEDFKDAGYQAFTNLLHPDDYERTMQAMRDHLESRAPLYQIDYRIKRADGNYTWYMDRGCTVERTDEGKPARLRGLVIDLGQELNQSSQKNAVFELLRKALADVRESTGIANLCVTCRKLKTEDGQWLPVDASFSHAFPMSVSHGLCPTCARTLYPEEADALEQE